MPPTETSQCAASADRSLRLEPAFGEDRVEVRRAPHVEAALHPFGVGIERRGEPAILRAQLGEEEVQGRARDVRVAVDTGRPERLDVGVGEEGVVVQHLLEVRDEPFGIGAVAREPAAELVVDATVGHRLERVRHHRQHRRVARPSPRAEQELDEHRCGELRRATPAAVGRVVGGRHPPDGLVELPALRVVVAGRHGKLRLEVADEHAGLLLDLVAPRAIRVRDRLQHAWEAGHPVPVLGREVRAAEEGAQVGGQEDAHRPATGAGHRLHGCHVDVVEVGTLLAVDLDAHELGVHACRDLGVLERLVRHHVAPVAGRVADGEEDRPILRPRPVEGLRTPRIPVDGVLRVLEQVRARLARQSVRRAHAPDVTPNCSAESFA